MSVRGQGRRTSYERTYVDGNTVRKIREMPERIPERAPKKLSNATRKNREKAAHMNLQYVSFLVLALATVCFLCIQYLQLQSDITGRVKNIEKMESTYNDLKLANDEEYARIMGAVDLEQIKQVAMDELGMSYPSGDQIIGFSSEGSDYVHQYSDIPTE